MRTSDHSKSSRFNEELVTTSDQRKPRRKKRAATGGDEMKRTKRWVEAELQKLRMSGVPILPSDPPEKVEGREIEKVDAVSTSNQSPSSFEREKEIANISRLVHEKWTSGRWRGVDRAHLDAMTNEKEYEDPSLKQMETLLSRLEIPMSDAERGALASFFLRKPSNEEVLVSEGRYGKKERLYVDRLRRWMRDWTYVASDRSHGSDNIGKTNTAYDPTCGFLNIRFSAADDRFAMSLPDAVEKVCEGQVREVTPSRQADVMSLLGLCGRSLRTPILAKDFVTSWLEKEGMASTSMLTGADSSRCAIEMWQRINRDLSTSSANGDSTASVYLGGTDGQWREEEAIPYLRTMDISYVDPSLFQDLPDRASLEVRARERAKVLLFVIRRIDGAVPFAMILEAGAQIARGRAVSVAVIDERSREEEETTQDIASYAWKTSVGYLSSIAESRGLHVFTRVKAAVMETVRLLDRAEESEKTFDSENAAKTTTSLSFEPSVMNASLAVDEKLRESSVFDNVGRVDELTKLKLENEMLKTELGALDEDFFADIEDLKFRYGRAVRQIDHLSRQLREYRLDENAARKRHKRIWDSMSEQLYDADKAMSGNLPVRDFRRIVCRHLRLSRDEAQKIVQSLPCDLFGCVNFVAFLNVGKILHNTETAREETDGEAKRRVLEDSSLPTLEDVEMKVERCYSAGLWKGLTQEQIREAVGQISRHETLEQIPCSVFRRGLRRLVEVTDMPIDEDDQASICDALVVGSTSGRKGDPSISVRRWFAMCEIWPLQKEAVRPGLTRKKEKRAHQPGLSTSTRRRTALRTKRRALRDGPSGKKR